MIPRTGRIGTRCIHGLKESATSYFFASNGSEKLRGYWRLLMRALSVGGCNSACTLATAQTTHVVGIGTDDADPDYEGARKKAD